MVIRSGFETLCLRRPVYCEVCDMARSGSWIPGAPSNNTIISFREYIRTFYTTQNDEPHAPRGFTFPRN